ILLSPPLSPSFPYTTLFRSGDGMFCRSSARLVARFAALTIALTFFSSQRSAFAQATTPANPAPQAPPATTTTPQRPAGLMSEPRSEEHTSELQSLTNLLCPL